MGWGGQPNWPRHTHAVSFLLLVLLPYPSCQSGVWVPRQFGGVGVVKLLDLVVVVVQLAATDVSAGCSGLCLLLLSCHFLSFLFLSLLSFQRRKFSRHPFFSKLPFFFRERERKKADDKAGSCPPPAPLLGSGATLHPPSKKKKKIRVPENRSHSHKVLPNPTRTAT